jgi:hypothetical protein
MSPGETKDTVPDIRVWKGGMRVTMAKVNLNWRQE